MRYFVCSRNSRGIESSVEISARGRTWRDGPAAEALACGMAKAGLVACGRWAADVGCSAEFCGAVLCWSKDRSVSGGVCARNVSQAAQADTWACKRSRASGASLPSAMAANCRGEGCVDCLVSMQTAPEKTVGVNRAERRIFSNMKAPANIVCVGALVKWDYLLPIK